MEKLSFYEQVGIVIPGSVFLFVVMFYVQELKDIFSKDGFSVGGLGIFVIISYAIGHLLAALGKIIEKFYWKLNGGIPSNWILGSKPRLLYKEQIAKVEALTVTRLGFTLPPFAELPEKDWFPIFRQIYSDIEKNGKSNRADIFNGNYGLNRGLSAASLSLSFAILIHSTNQWIVSLVLLGISFVYIYRMNTFGQTYAREVYTQFLLLPPEPSNKKYNKEKSDSE